MTIGILGAGYVGLATVAGFAARGFSVVCADVDEKKVTVLQSGELPFFEEGMLEVFAASSIPVQFTTDLALACRSDVVFCCVGTPSAANGSADLSFVESVARTCADAAPNAVFVLKSTVPPGTSRSISALVDGQLRVAANPEFLREGHATADALHPSRVVIGADDALTLTVLEDLYRDTDAPIVSTNTITAEMIKYASNSFLATKISFINDIANLCDIIGADVRSVAKGMGLDDRIGSKFLQPGPGYGGSCFPKDVRALMHLSESVGVPLRILEAVTAVNADRQSLPYRQLVKSLGDLHGKQIAIWGLAFKAGTDDVRDAPALKLIDQCIEAGAKIIAYDPKVRSLSSECNDVEIVSGAIDALKNADALVIMTEWPEFFRFDRAEILKAMNGNCIIDPRYVLVS